jgi:hypothetical protein
MSTRGRKGRQRGVTLLEIMLSMAVVLAGMLGLFRVLSVTSRGASTAQHVDQAHARAQHLVESISSMPLAVINCLVANTANAWGACEATCQGALGGGLAAQQACVFSTASLPLIKQNQDTTRQQYAIVYDAANLERSTSVRPGNGATRLWEVRVTIGFNDDGTAPAAPPYDHRVTMWSKIFR